MLQSPSGWLIATNVYTSAAHNTMPGVETSARMASHHVTTICLLNYSCLPLIIISQSLLRAKTIDICSSIIRLNGWCVGDGVVGRVAFDSSPISIYPPFPHPCHINLK